MSRTLKITVMALLSAILFLSPVNVYGLKSSEDSLWEDDALCYPYTGQLVPAGPIKVQWKALNDSHKYNVYLDNHLVKSISNNDSELISCEVYTTEVASHQVKIIAIKKDESQISTDPVNFYVSKKGLAYENVNDVENLNASWYYNWGTAPTFGVKTSLEYVPMIWGAGSETSKLNSIKNSGYDVVLGYNEPEGNLSGQSHIDVDKAASNAVYFTNSGMRVGSPAVEHLSSILQDDSWFDQYMKKVNQDDIDFIAVHEYLPNICSCDDNENTKKYAKEFLLNLQKVYDKYHKPIWITELGIANWDEYWKHYSYSCEEGKQEVYEFMTYIMDGVDDVKGLNDLNFVERYAWFPFDMTSDKAGASSLFVTETDYNNDSSLNLGELNDLGKLYRDCGNPFGYTIQPNIECANIAIDQIEYTGSQLKPKATVKYNGETLIENKDYKISYINNVNAGQGKAIIKGIGKYIGTVITNFTISRKSISNLSYSSISAQRFTGNSVTPNITVKDGQKTLVKGTDYTLSYSNNIFTSTNAKMMITGQGNYQGTKTKTFEIKEYPMIGVSLNKTLLTLNKGSKGTLTATFTPSNTTDSTSLRWTSTDTRVATVSDKGVVTAIKPGTATITAFTTKSDIKATCQVTVKSPITSVKLDKTSSTILKGKTLTLKSTINPTDTTDSKTLKWTSSNTKVATVSSSGVVKGINGGTAKITVKTSNGKTATCTVTVPYTITYQLNGGVNNKNNPSSYYGKTVKLANPTRKGYTFQGWYSDSKFKTRVTKIAKGSTGNKNLYAKWSKVSVAKAKTPTLTNTSEKKLKITYSATTGAKGYQIQYATNSKFSKATTKTVSGRSATYTLSKGKTYYVRVRAYKIDSTGSKVYGSWSSVKSKKITK